MNELSSLGLILLCALAFGHLVKYIRVPEITGYILAGIALGPSALGWVSHENLTTLGTFSEVALGLILFSLGSVFEWGRVRASGPAIARVAVTETSLVFVFVFASMILLGQQWQAALLLGAIAMETAAASTLMVLRECNAAGPLSESLTAVIGINNILCLVVFSLAATVLDLSTNASAGASLPGMLYQSLFPLVWQVVGSVALGYLVGLLLAGWAANVIEHGETLMLLIGCVLLCVGAALLLELSALIASLAVGATMVNLSAQSRRLFQALSRTDPPLYAIFFVIAGADLNLGLLKTLGVAGLVYVIARGAGKLLGARIGSRKAGLPEPTQRLLGFSMMSHAGLAVGISIAIGRRFPDYGPAVSSIVLSAVVIYEILGPLAARMAVVRSGEARPTQHPELVLGAE